MFLKNSELVFEKNKSKQGSEMPLALTLYVKMLQIWNFPKSSNIYWSNFSLQLLVGNAYIFLRSINFANLPTTKKIALESWLWCIKRLQHTLECSFARLWWLYLLLFGLDPLMFTMHFLWETLCFANLQILNHTVAFPQMCPPFIAACHGRVIGHQCFSKIFVIERPFFQYFIFQSVCSRWKL